MESIQELFRIGCGPSSSYTMAPRRAAELFRQRNTEATRFRVTLYGSLAATGRGHLTDAAIKIALVPMPVEVVWRPDKTLPFYPNGMAFEALGVQDQLPTHGRCTVQGAERCVSLKIPTSTPRFTH
jgi:L-serine dehydratase